MILKAVHSKGIIHGDVHPGNSLGGLGSYINFYFATADRISSDLKSELLSLSLTGSLLTPIHFTQGLLSLVDDLISLAYTLFFLVNGYLPWAEYLTPSGAPIDLPLLVASKVISSNCRPNYLLCADLPSVFHNFLSLVLNLEETATFHDNDYDSYIKAFRNLSDLQFIPQ